jgi:hypothetical protein
MTPAVLCSIRTGSRRNDISKIRLPSMMIHTSACFFLHMAQGPDFSVSFRENDNRCIPKLPVLATGISDGRLTGKTGTSQGGGMRAVRKDPLHPPGRSNLFACFSSEYRSIPAGPAEGDFMLAHVFRRVQIAHVCLGMPDALHGCVTENSGRNTSPDILGLKRGSWISDINSKL